MTIPLRPQPGYLIVNPDAPPGQVGEIILPEQNTLRPTSGVVVRAEKELEQWYPPGTRIVFGPHAGSVFSITSGTFLILTDMEIQAVIDEEPRA